MVANRSKHKGTTTKRDPLKSVVPHAPVFEVCAECVYLLSYNMDEKPKGLIHIHIEVFKMSSVHSSIYRETPWRCSPTLALASPYAYRFKRSDLGRVRVVWPNIRLTAASHRTPLFETRSCAHVR